MVAREKLEFINIAILDDEKIQKNHIQNIFGVKNKLSSENWEFIRFILGNIKRIDRKIHLNNANSDKIAEIHSSFDRKNHDSFFSAIFHAYVIPKIQTFLSLYLLDFKMDSLTLLRNLIEFTIFASWVDCVTQFNTSLLEFLWKPEVLAGLDIHHMNSFDFNTRLASIKTANNYNNLSRQEFEHVFVNKGNPADFFFLLFKSTCNDCKNKKKGLSYLFRRALLWETSDLLIEEKNRVLTTEKKKDDRGQQKRVEGTSEFSFDHFFSRMTKSAITWRDKKESVKVEVDKTKSEAIKDAIYPSIDISKRLNPVFGQDHLKKCSFCQSKPGTEALLQLPHFILQIIWLQKIFPDVKVPLIKIRLAWTFLTDNYTHFSLKSLSKEKSQNSSFDYFDRKIDLFSIDGIIESFDEIFTLILRILAYQERYFC